ncbi:MAG: M55 family metallopeptidase [Steroidobacteraceae bacterium]
MLAAALLFTVVTATAAQRMKVYISADMEGIGGIVSSNQVSRGQPEYESGRQLMTDEVNAAIEGALQAGAAEIVVSDSHGRGENLIPERLHPAARLVRGFPRPLDMMQDLDASFGAVLLIGYHASSGTGDATLAHTMSRRIATLKVNGVTVAEGGFNAAVAGHFGVPVVLMSGDQASIEEMRKLVRDIEGVPVKVAHGMFSATTMHPDASRRLIRDGARRAIERVRSIGPYRVTKPVELEISFVHPADAEVISWLPGVERTAGDTVRARLPDMVAAARFVSAAMWVSTPTQ